MQKLRSYSVIWIVLLALLAGITVQQAVLYNSDDKPDELTRWLMGFAADYQTDQAFEKLSGIDRKSVSDQDVIALASGIMLDNPDLFTLPHEDGEQDDLARVLMLQWTAQQPSSGMNSSAQVERNRNGKTNTHESPTRYIQAAVRSVAATASAVIKEALPAPSELIDRFLKPLLDGIAINAP
ncbi:MAG: hypothetical protein JJU41_13560 [Bacteroidetes bacterium]|nr:hypothetical protein [Bacteroidota bacterium]MCH8523788.1 hypothetical protein [Balneolales bacterium]